MMILKVFESMGLGQLPEGYNRAVHGPYNPSLYYGPKDTAFGEVKLAQLPSWLSRRSKNPVDWGRACSRAYWRWCLKWQNARNAKLVPVVQMWAGLCFAFWVMNYTKLRQHKNYTYHW